MSMILLKDLETRKAGSLARRAVLKSLCYHAKPSQTWARMTIDEIAIDTEMHRRTAFKTLLELIAEGFLKINEKESIGDAKAFELLLHKLPTNELFGK